MTDETAKKRKSNHVALDLTKPVWIIMRQTKQTTVIEYANDEEAARSLGNDMAVKSGGTVAVFGPQSFIYDVSAAVETPFHPDATDEVS